MNSSHARTDCLQYCIELVTRVMVNLQQKPNIALNDRIEPKSLSGSVLPPGMPNGAFSVLLLIFFWKEI